jgi:hypothetical protein
MSLIAHYPLINDVKDYSGNAYNGFSNDKLRFTWYNHTFVSHPTTTLQLDSFFIPGPNVTFGGTGFFNQAINFSNLSGKPAYLPATSYSWMVEGYIIAPESGWYKFGIDSDDASDITINGSIVTTFYGAHGFANDLGESHSAQIYLAKGHHTFRARFEQISGGDGIRVY